MERCPKKNGLCCPLFDPQECSNRNEDCILVETFCVTEKIDMIKVRFESLFEASRKVFAQFGIRLDNI